MSTEQPNKRRKLMGNFASSTSGEHIVGKANEHTEHTEDTEHTEHTEDTSQHSILCPVPLRPISPALIKEMEKAMAQCYGIY